MPSRKYRRDLRTAVSSSILANTMSHLNRQKKYIISVQYLSERDHLT